jgi:hypothetical protein
VTGLGYGEPSGCIIQLVSELRKNKQRNGVRKKDGKEKRWSERNKNIKRGRRTKLREQRRNKMQTKGIREEKEKRRKSCVYGKKETKER